MADVWSQRAQAYVESDAHRQGADLDLLVEWAAGARTALDVASGGGHVARRLREAGLEVVTADPSPGMKADVRCTADSIPFADASFDVVACRTAAHHFPDLRAAVRELARVAGDRVLLVDTLNTGPELEEAERLRDPSHVRNYTDAEWREVVVDAGLGLDDVRFLEHPVDLAAWLARTGCEGETAERVVELLGRRVDGDVLTLEKIAIRAAVGI